MTWQEEFLEALAGYVVEHGHISYPPVYTRAEAEERLLVEEHLREGCGLVLGECSYSDWHERYLDSYDFPDCDYGVEMLVTCECRLADHVPWRVDTGFGDLIREITRG